MRPLISCPLIALIWIRVIRNGLIRNSLTFVRRHDLFFIPLALVLSIASAQAATEFEGRVIRIADGDSITVQVGQRERYEVRLGAIDAPEIGQAYGKASRKSLAALVADKTVLVNFYKIDRFGRLIATVLVGGRDVALMQVQRGMAWHFKRFQNEQTEQDRASFAAAQDDAQKKRTGLWQESDAQPPWQWRKKIRPLRTSALPAT